MVKYNQLTSLSFKGLVYHICEYTVPEWDGSKINTHIKKVKLPLTS